MKITYKSWFKNPKVTTRIYLGLSFWCTSSQMLKGWILEFASLQHLWKIKMKCDMKTEKGVGKKIRSWSNHKENNQLRRIQNEYFWAPILNQAVSKVPEKVWQEMLKRIKIKNRGHYPPRGRIWAGAWSAWLWQSAVRSMVLSHWNSSKPIIPGIIGS